MEIDREWEKFAGGPFVPFGQRIFGIAIDRTLSFTSFETEPGPMLVLNLSTAEALKDTCFFAEAV